MPGRRLKGLQVAQVASGIGQKLLSPLQAPPQGPGAIALNHFQSPQLPLEGRDLRLGGLDLLRKCVDQLLQGLRRTRLAARYVVCGSFQPLHSLQGIPQVNDDLAPSGAGQVGGQIPQLLLELAHLVLALAGEALLGEAAQGRLRHLPGRGEAILELLPQLWRQQRLGRRQLPLELGLVQVLDGLLQFCSGKLCSGLLLSLPSQLHLHLLLCCQDQRKPFAQPLCLAIAVGLAHDRRHPVPEVKGQLGYRGPAGAELGKQRLNLLEKIQLVLAALLFTPLILRLGQPPLQLVRQACVVELHAALVGRDHEDRGCFRV
mmetsp:Transcript_39439/g.94235  ORF Transcript_39439/g.94235 Transcript_39439/m.94235 type:complete len:317 (+) Transcript_39439:1926-2876(+)